MAKVLKRFMDKETKKLYLKDQEFEGKAARVKHLAKLGFVEAPKEEPKAKDGE